MEREPKIKELVWADIFYWFGFIQKPPFSVDGFFMKYGIWENNIAESQAYKQKNTYHK